MAMSAKRWRSRWTPSDGPSMPRERAGVAARAAIVGSPAIDVRLAAAVLNLFAVLLALVVVCATMPQSSDAGVAARWYVGVRVRSRAAPEAVGDCSQSVLVLRVA